MQVSLRGAGLTFLNNSKKDAERPQGAQSTMLQKMLRHAELEQQGGTGKALLDGAVYAKSAFVEKTWDSSYDGIHRYDGGNHHYWNNFFVNTEKNPLKNTYFLKESGQDEIIHSWNSFMNNVTNNPEAFLNKPQFSAMA